MCGAPSGGSPPSRGTRWTPLLARKSPSSPPLPVPGTRCPPLGEGEPVNPYRQPAQGRTILEHDDQRHSCCPCPKRRARSPGPHSPQGTRDKAREVFRQGRRIHQRGRRPSGSGVGPTYRGYRQDRSRRVLRRRWGRGRRRRCGPRHKYFVATSAHEVLVSYMTSDRNRPLHNTRHF